MTRKEIEELVDDDIVELSKVIDNFISIPVSVSVIQYLGEPVVEYQNE